MRYELRCEIANNRRRHGEAQAQRNAAKYCTRDYLQPDELVAFGYNVIGQGTVE